MVSNAEVAASECVGKRIKAEMRVYYGQPAQKLLAGFSVDLSTGGLYLKTNFPFTVDENLVLHFTLPDLKKTVTCKAKVAWVNLEANPRKPELPPGIGVQFVDLSLDGMKAIRRFLEHNEIEPTW